MSLDFVDNCLAIVITTESNYTNARLLASYILEMKLSKCVSFCKIDSIYFWEGTLQESQEVQLTIKTIPELLDQLIIAIKNKHTYELPQIISLGASSSKEYNEWLR